MDIQGVKDASRPELVSYASEITVNAQSLIDDAELLFANGRFPRAYSLAALAVEEFGKATGVLTLAVLPDEMRATVPLRDLLVPHLVKHAGGLLITALQAGTPGVAARVGATPVTELAEVLAATMEQAQASDGMKLRGLYADMDAAGNIHKPADITAAEARDQLARARAASASVAMLTDPAALARLSDPPADAMELSAMLFGPYFAARGVDTAEGAAQAAMAGLGRMLKHLGGGTPEAAQRS